MNDWHEKLQKDTAVRQLELWQQARDRGDEDAKSGLRRQVPSHLRDITGCPEAYYASYDARENGDST